jgi:uncharacterized RmlC-like cupin family protein
MDDAAYSRRNGGSRKTFSVLDSGDSIYFDSSLPHSYRRISQKPCSAIVVIVP